MKNTISVWTILIFAMIMTALPVASAGELKDTVVDYMDYREIVPGDAGVVFKIRLTNLDDKTRTYEITPNTDVVRQLGTYRIDPSHKVTLRPLQTETLYFYLSLEKSYTGRVSIPTTITSGTDSLNLELAARSVGPFVQYKQPGLMEALKIFFFALIAIIIIVMIIKLVRDKNKKEGDEVETYY